jgi:hypothetical protein
MKRRRWYTDEELAACQLVKMEDSDAYWVLVAGDRLGTVEPHLTATGSRSGWQARLRGGGMAWHLDTGVRGGGTPPATRRAAVTDLLADAHYRWKNRHEQGSR